MLRLLARQHAGRVPTDRKNIPHKRSQQSSSRCEKPQRAFRFNIKRNGVAVFYNCNR